METFSRMTAKNKYKKLVFYLEVTSAFIFSLVNRDRCLWTFQLILPFTVSQLPIQLNLPGATIALLMMLFRESILDRAWVICSALVLLRIGKQVIWLGRPGKLISRRWKLEQPKVTWCSGETNPTQAKKLARWLDQKLNWSTWEKQSLACSKEPNTEKLLELMADTQK